jgi:hypothetical protein
LGLVLQHHKDKGGRLGGDSPDDAERAAGAIVPAKNNPRDSFLALPDQIKDSSLLLPAAEDAEHSSHPLQLGGRAIAQEPGERPTADQRRPVQAEQAETNRTSIHQRTKLLLGIPEGVLHPAPVGHRILEVGNLLSQCRDLIDEVLLGSVLIPHGRE